MKRLTVAEIKKIESINGTLKNRIDYIEALQEIVGTNGCVSCRFNKNHMTTISLDKTTIMEIETKTIKGNRYVVRMWINDFAKDSRKGLYLERVNKTGKWLVTYDSDWFTVEGNWKSGCEAAKNSEYIG